MAHIQGKAASKNRLDKLEAAIVKTVQTVLKKPDGDFTVNEVVSVLNKLGWQFTQRGLDNQYLEADGTPEGNDNVHQLNSKGNA